MDPPARPLRPRRRVLSRSVPASTSGIISASSSSSSSPANSNPTFPDMALPSQKNEDALVQLAETKLPSHTTLGQLSYAPTTQTTVVTTTTTTTTSFPPLLMKGTRHLHDLDPKQYPLAASPTPQAVRSFCFDLAGTPTYYKEAEDPSEALSKIQRQCAALDAAKGTLKTITKSEPRYDTPTSLKRPRASSTANTSTRPHQANISASGQGSPVSISRAAELARQQRRNGSSRLMTGPFEETNHVASSSLGQSRSFHTTSIDEGDNQIFERPAKRHHSSRIQDALDSPDTDQQDTPSTLSPESGPSQTNPFSDDEMHDTSDDQTSGTLGRSPRSARSVMTANSIATATPPIAETDLQTSDVAVDNDLVSFQLVGAGLPEALTVQDASLPSPSLSPVTAALNHGGNDYFGHAAANDDVDSTFQLPPPRESPPAPSQRDVLSLTTPVSQPNDQLQISRPSRADFSNPQLPSPTTIMEIPAIIDSFDAMPTEMQTYLMYQFLRRCAKPTLHFVAEVVNPALKCDFLSTLPLELSLHIVRSLDVQSLCRASQVSKKWRNIVNSDERAWKELFDRDGYVMPEGELQRAIKEGWGWQHPSGADGAEEDVSLTDASSQDSNVSTMSSTKGRTFSEAPEGSLYTPQSGRPKRKAVTRSSSRKLVKKSQSHRSQSDSMVSVDWMAQLGAAEGPYAAATAAAMAIPDPSVGLPSLKNLHLYKSIYQRHHSIRQAWMRDDVKPRHIAFRAHQGCVVTCLQFDTDKIITGSDDSSINVYDTQTGALRTTLEGHEGGVWALQYEGNVLVSGSTDRSVRVWDIEHGVCTQVFHGHTSTVRCLQILMPAPVGETPDGRPIMMPKQPLIITGSRDSSLKVWKLPQPGDAHYFQGVQPQNDNNSPYFVRTLSGHHQSVRAIAAHGDTVVSGSYDCMIRVWKISTGECVHRLTGHAQKVYSVALDHKRNRCISSSMDNLIKVWSLDTGAVLYNLEGHISLVGLLDLSYDRLVSAAADSTLRIWDPENGQCKSILSAHTGAITCFQQDGQKVISGSDRTLKMWDVKTGEFVRDLLGDLSGVWQVKFNERRCVAAVQRKRQTYIEVLDFGASRDSVPAHLRGRRILVNAVGEEIPEPVESETDEVVIDE